MNKMHFYCFLPYLHLISQVFSVSSASSVVFSRRPFRNPNLVPRLSVVGVVLLTILTDRSSRKQKYLDYD